MRHLTPSSAAFDGDVILRKQNCSAVKRRLERLVMCAVEYVFTEGAIDHYQLEISVLNIFLLAQFESSFVPEIYTFRCYFVNCFANPG